MSTVHKSKFPHNHRVARNMYTRGTKPIGRPPTLPESDERDTDERVFGLRFAPCPGCREHALSNTHARACPLPHRNAPMTPEPVYPALGRPAYQRREKDLDNRPRHHDDER